LLLSYLLHLSHYPQPLLIFFPQLPSAIFSPRGGGRIFKYSYATAWNLIIATWSSGVLLYAKMLLSLWSGVKPACLQADVGYQIQYSHIRDCQNATFYKYPVAK
jgi:hypothetical protein